MKTVLPIAAAMLAISCASGPAPTQQVASALAAVRGAEEAGALSEPQAALHVKLAEDQITRARQLIEEEDNQRARSLAVRAHQDAELAIAIARERQAQRQLDAFAHNHTSATQSTAAGGEQNAMQQNTTQSQ
jgi:hypothetical protein